MGPKKRGKKQAASPKRVTRSRGGAAAATKSEEEITVTMEVEEEHEAEEAAVQMETEEVAPVEELEDEKHEEPEEEEMVENEGEEEKFHDAVEEVNDEGVQLEEETNAKVQPEEAQPTEGEGITIQEEDLPDVLEADANEMAEVCAVTEEVGVAAKTFVIGSPEAAASLHTGVPDEDYSPIINAALAVKPPMDEITVEEKAAAVAEAAEAAVAEAVEAAVGDITQAVADTKPRSRKPRNKWSKEEDHELMKLITAQGLTDASPLSAVASVDFNAIAQQLDLGRTAKQCRDRWKNYLRGGIKKGGWSKDEEELIKDMYSTFGPKWTAMAKLLTNRTDNDIKNKWYSMKRKEERMGLHEPSIYPKNLANRASTSDDQEITDVPEDIAQRAATLSRVGVVGNPEPTAPTVAVSAPAPAASAEAESDSAAFVDRNWSAEVDANKAAV